MGVFVPLSSHTNPHVIAATHAAFATGLYLGGYGSHLWLDMLNVRGIDLFRPSPIRVVLPNRPAYRLEVGSVVMVRLLVQFVHGSTP